MSCIVWGQQLTLLSTATNWLSQSGGSDRIDMKRFDFCSLFKSDWLTHPELRSDPASVCFDGKHLPRRPAKKFSNNFWNEAVLAASKHIVSRKSILIVFVLAVAVELVTKF